MPDLPATPADPGRPVRVAGVPPRPERLRELPPRPLVTIGAVVLALLLAAAATLWPGGEGRSGRVGIFLVVLLAGLVLANGWTRVVDLPSRKGTALVAALGAVTTSVAVLLPASGPSLQWLPVALALSVVAAFLHQLLRTDARPRVVASLSGSLLALSLLASGACWVALADETHGRDAVVVAAVALAVAALVEPLLHRSPLVELQLPLSMALGGVVAALLAPALGLPWAVALLIGALACAVAVSVRSALAPLPALVARRAQLVSSTASVLGAGAVVLVAARGFLG